MKTNKVLVALGLSALATTSQALPLVDLYGGAYYWRADYQGDIEAKTGNANTDLNLKDDLGLSASSANMFLIGLEHAVPVIPDVQIRHTNLVTDGKEPFGQSISFGGKTFSANENVSTDMDLTHTDYTFYWGLPIPMTRINFGLTMRHFSGEVKMKGETSGVEASEDLNLFLPLGYARAEMDVPTTDLQIGAEVNGIGYAGSSLIDFNLYANYNFTVALLDIGLTAGYRSFNLKVDSEDFGGDDDDLAVSAAVNGPYAGVTLHL